MATDQWTVVKDQHPRAHQKYIVKRNGFQHTATPCYGMHMPWWVVMTMQGEVEPVDMQDGDLWKPLEGE